MTNRTSHQTHHFAEGAVITFFIQALGQFGAYRDQDDGRVRGYGHNRHAAIADLVEAISKTEEDEETNREDYRTPFTGEIAAEWQADRARSIATAE